MLKDWKFWVSLGAGFISGAVVGLMYAPMEGTEARKKVRVFADDLAGGASYTARRAAGAAQNSLTVYGAGVRGAGARIDRLFKAVAAGVDEANRVREAYKQRSEAAENRSEA